MAEGSASDLSLTNRRREALQDRRPHALVLIDGPYLQCTQFPEVGLTRNWINYAAFKTVLVREALFDMKPDEVEFRFYTRFRMGKQDFLKILAYQGYRIRKTWRQDVDAFIIQELLRTIRHFDALVLVSGDGGFIGPLRRAAAADKVIKVAAFASSLNSGYWGLAEITEIIDLEKLKGQFSLVTPALASADP